MVLRIHPDSREISFRIDDWQARKPFRGLLPIGVLRVYSGKASVSITKSQIAYSDIPVGEGLTFISNGI
jgi:hypothetical protein